MTNTTPALLVEALSLGYVVADMLDEEKGITLPVFEINDDLSYCVTVEGDKHDIELKFVIDGPVTWMMVSSKTLESLKEPARLMVNYPIEQRADHYPRYTLDTYRESL